MFLKKLLHYLNPLTVFNRGNPDPSLRFMHGVNRISLMLFLVGVVVMVARAISR
jgi:hypothetical protein